MTTYHVADYCILKVTFPNSIPSSQHSLYCKIHSDHIDGSELPNGRTLFVAGIPFYAKREGVAKIFSSLGSVSTIHLSKSPGASKLITAKPNKDPYLRLSLPNIDNFVFAYIVFENEIELESVRRICRESIESPVSCAVVKCLGIDSWIQEYKDERPDATQLESQVKRFMTKYDARRQQEENRVKKRKNQPDEDGWITVTSKNTNKIPKSKLSRIKLRKVSRKKKKNELLHFYKFQMREEKRDNIMQLQKKFDEDKNKITAMKLQRKFKPL